MGTKRAILPIDGDRLAEALAKKNFTKADASKILGYGPDYLANASCTGYISRATQLMLETLCGVKYKDYQALETATPSKKRGSRKGKRYAGARRNFKNTAGNEQR